MAVNTIDYPSIGERAARGDDARTRTPPSSHTGWEPAADRPDPVARSGDPVAIIACLGDSDAFDQAVTDFSHRYADQNEREYEEFVRAIHSGRLEAREGV